MLGGDDDQGRGRGRESNEDGRSQPGRVHHPDEIGGASPGRMGKRVLWPVGTPVAASIPGDDPVAPGEVRDLGLPDPRVNDLPWRNEHDWRVAGTVAVPEDLTA